MSSEKSDNSRHRIHFYVDHNSFPQIWQSQEDGEVVCHSQEDISNLLGSVGRSQFFPRLALQKTLEETCVGDSNFPHAVVSTTGDGKDMVETYKQVRQIAAQFKKRINFLGLVNVDEERFQMPGAFRDCNRTNRDEYVTFPDPSLLNTVVSLITTMKGQNHRSPHVLVFDTPQHESMYTSICTQTDLSVHMVNDYDSALDSYLFAIPTGAVLNINSGTRRSIEASNILHLILKHNEDAVKKEDPLAYVPILCYYGHSSMRNNRILLLGMNEGLITFRKYDAKHFPGHLHDFVNAISDDFEHDPAYFSMQDQRKYIQEHKFREMELPLLLSSDDQFHQIYGQAQLALQRAKGGDLSYRKNIQNIVFKYLGSSNEEVSVFASNQLMDIMHNLPGDQRERSSQNLKFALDDATLGNVQTNPLHFQILTELRRLVDETRESHRPSSPHRTSTYIMEAGEVLALLKLGEPDLIKKSGITWQAMNRLNRWAQDSAFAHQLPDVYEAPLFTNLSGFRGDALIEDGDGSVGTLLEIEKFNPTLLTDYLLDKEIPTSERLEKFEEGYTASAYLLANGPIHGNFHEDIGTLSDFFSSRLIDRIIPSFEWLFGFAKESYESTDLQFLYHHRDALNTLMLETVENDPNSFPIVFSPDNYDGNMAIDAKDDFIYKFDWVSRLFPINIEMANMWQLGTMWKQHLETKNLDPWIFESDRDPQTLSQDYESLKDSFVGYLDAQAISFLQDYDHALSLTFNRLASAYGDDYVSFVADQMKRDLIDLRRYSTTSKEHAGKDSTLFYDAEGALKAFSYAGGYPSFDQIEAEIKNISQCKARSHGDANKGIIRYLELRKQKSADSLALVKYLDGLQQFCHMIQAPKNNYPGAMDPQFGEQLEKSFLPLYHDSISLKALTSYATFVSYLRNMNEAGELITPAQSNTILRRGLAQMDMAIIGAEQYSRRMGSLDISSKCNSLIQVYSSIKEHTKNIIVRNVSF